MVKSWGMDKKIFKSRDISSVFNNKGGEEMKFALAAIFLVASVMALGGIASAVVPGPDAQDVSVTGTIAPYLSFVIMENAAGIDLSPTVTPSNQLIEDGTTGLDSIDTNGGWVITLVAPLKMTTATHELSNNLVVGYDAARYEGPNGAVASGTPTGAPVGFNTYYGQQYALTDYSGAYSATATWTATPTF